MYPFSQHTQPELHNRTHSDPLREGKGVTNHYVLTTRETYSVGYDSWSVNSSRLYGLEDIHYTFCLQTLQLRVDDQECPTANNSITGKRIHIQTLVSYKM